MTLIEFNDGDICISLDIYALIESLPPEVAERVADALSIRDDVIENVADQIIGAWTRRQSCGATELDPLKPTALDAAVRTVAENASETAKNEIERLNQHIERLMRRYQPRCSDCKHLYCTKDVRFPCCNCYNFATNNFEAKENK